VSVSARAVVMLCLISVTALVACSGDEDAVALERGEPAPLAQAEYTYHHSEEYEGRVLWETRAVEDIGDRSLMAVLYPGDRSGIAGGFTAHLVDRSTGELVGEVTSRSYAFGAYHAPSGRLVVAYMRFAPPPDHDPDASGGFAPWYWLVSFDIDAGLAPEIEVPLGPDVAQFSTGPGRVVERGTLTLSRDGRYAYVAMSGQSDDATLGVAVIDLAGDAEIIGPVPYPSRDERTCGRVEPAIYPYEHSSVMVTCTAGGLVRVIDPDGNVREDFDINGMGYVFGFPEWGDRVVEVATAVEAPRGLGLVQRDGTYAVLHGGSMTEVGRALPERTTLLPNWASDVLMLDDTRLVLPYRTREDAAASYVPFGTPAASGLVVFDLESDTITHNFVIGHRGSYPLADGSIAIVEEGRVDIIDLEVGRIVQSFEAVTLEDQVGAEAAADMPPGRIVLPRVR
jgi:hypothetical protein